MNARILRRFLLPVGIAAALASASVYAMTGTSSAASTPQSPKATAIKTVRVEVRVVNKAGKTVRVEASEARVVPVGSAGVKQTGGAAPDGTYSTDTPSDECLMYFYYAASVDAGGYAQVEFSPTFEPFVVGSMFNETAQVRDAVESLYQDGDNVYVSVENNSSGSQNYVGFYGALYNPNDGSC
jgi:hypothetical protein